MTRRYIIGVACILALVIVCGKCFRRDDGRYKSNQEVLLGDSLRAFVVRDSLNAVEKEHLRLTISELERYRADDAKLIRELRQRGEDMERYASASTSTSNNIRTEVREMVRYDTVLKREIVYKDFSYADKWVRAEGSFVGDSLSLVVTTYDSLFVVEYVKYKRFLGFLWKTKKVKSRRVKIVSKNPNTTILGCEYAIVE